jgi:hypothetical protein
MRTAVAQHQVTNPLSVRPAAPIIFCPYLGIYVSSGGTVFPTLPCPTRLPTRPPLTPLPPAPTSCPARPLPHPTRPALPPRPVLPPHLPAAMRRSRLKAQGF